MTTTKHTVRLDDAYADGAPAITVEAVIASGELDGSGIVVLTPAAVADGQGHQSLLVAIENCGGKLMCHVWANKAADEPTHDIELEVAAFEPQAG